MSLEPLLKLFLSYPLRTKHLFTIIISIISKKDIMHEIDLVFEISHEISHMKKEISHMNHYSALVVSGSVR